jgi:peptide/nickel transport system substrate-binding protein
VKRSMFVIISLVALTSLILAGCGPKATATVAPATEVPAATEASAATEVPEEPTEAPPPAPVSIATYDETSLSVPDCDYSGFFKSIVATDANTVTFTLCKSDAAFLQKMAFSVFSIYPKDWIESTAGTETRTSEGLENPIGTGPYMVGEWKRGESLTFVPNPNYWGDAPKAQTLVFRWSTESAARLLELQSGTIDGFDNVGPEDFATILADPDLQLIYRPALNIFYVGMTNTFAPFDDVKVRQAIAMGIDRQRIVDTFYPGGSEVATHFTPCSVPNGCVGDDWYAFDPVAAKALLADAGYPDGFSTKLYYRDVVRSYLPQVSNVAQDIQAQLLANLNINAEIVVMETGAFIEESGAGRLDGLYLLGWNGDYPHITNFLDFHFGEANPQFGNPFPAIYDNLVKGSQIGIPADAEEYYLAANNAIRELVPMVPIAHGSSGVAYRADVVNAQASPLGNEMFAVSTPGDRDIFVWMQNAEPISLFCADESDGESLRACEQVTEALFSYQINGTEVVPGLATGCTPNADSTVWVCNLRQGVKFSDGSDFTALDVVATFNMGLNPGSPYHVGNTNLWEYYDYLWGIMWK